ncbi:Glyoxylate/hydroxypyruvate reductase A [Leucobacter aridicollis]|uniref:Phosphoglycerate dehydrogenase-like enzyme n=1 Tax=Leucobacter aridicollis TaxID=283878 RepID=A0A852RB47_9MICO|nr:2-hydroxyacid dehydrogenase [Leucobacter aridicollis]MBL3680959.1 hydroxyacid dehydrogenase [Leucobacter aridicollis]NYD28038.1 phosphoglycerate dehydrogenase-like enzyme [Leucobacter aridicollis]
MSDFVLSLPTDPGLRAAIGEIDGVDIVEWDLDGPAPRSHIDIIVPPYWGGIRRLAKVSEVSAQLIQWQSIGYNGIEKYLPSGYPLANATSVHEAATAELAVGLAIASQRGLPRFIRDGLEGKWELQTFPSLADRNVLIVGYGGVGKAIEARLAGFETKITRLARSARDEQNLAGETVHVHGLDELHALLPATEVLILGLPLSDETRGLFDAAAFAALPDDALVVNVGRGPLVVTEDLVAELTAGRLRAALDVTDPEPLPADHPLWSLPNALITPHAGGDSTAMMPRMVSLIQRQIAALRAGERPENIVLGG